MFPGVKENGYLEALRHPHTHRIWADVFSGSTPIKRHVRVVDGSITADVNQQIRYTGQVTLDFDIDDRRDLPTSRINVYKTRIALYSAITGVNDDPDDPKANTFVVPLGLYRVANTSRDTLGLMQMDLEGLEGYVIDDKFMMPTTPVTNLSPDAATKSIPYVIRDLVVQSFTPSASPGVNSSSPTINPWGPNPDGVLDVINVIPFYFDLDTPPPEVGETPGEDSQWRALGNDEALDRERWTLIDRLAKSIDAHVYAGPDGAFHLRSRSSRRMRYGVFNAEWFVSKGRYGLITSLNTSISRDNVYNGVVVHNDSVNISTSADTSQTVPRFAVVWDDDPDSPVYWRGAFGRKPLFISNTFIEEEREMKWHAIYRLNDAFGDNRQMSFNSVVNYALEPDDLIYVETPAGVIERHVVEQITFPLTHAGAMSVSTKAKSELKFLIWDDLPPDPTKPVAGVYTWDVQEKQWKRIRTRDDLNTRVDPTGSITPLRPSEVGG